MISLAVLFSMRMTTMWASLVGRGVEVMVDVDGLATTTGERDGDGDDEVDPLGRAPQPEAKAATSRIDAAKAGHHLVSVGDSWTSCFFCPILSILAYLAVAVRSSSSGSTSGSRSSTTLGSGGDVP
jgi:hypothetical protein